MKLKIIGTAILAAGLIFTGCGENTADNSNNVAAQAINEKFPQFTTINLNGDTVTSDIFAKKKITVVNIWGTFCPPCIAEMPELGEWAKTMPTDAQLIGLVCDVRGNDDTKTIDAANKILAGANANFVNILPNAEIAKYLESVYAVPTTIFVDANGNLIGDPIIGADVDSYKKRIKDYLNE